MVQIGHYAMRAQGLGQLIQLLTARYTDRKMVKADPPLTEAITWRRSGRRRPEHQAVVVADP